MAEEAAAFRPEGAGAFAAEEAGVFTTEGAGAFRPLKQAQLKTGFSPGKPSQIEHKAKHRRCNALGFSTQQRTEV
jgi:hypothetical protein